MTVAAPPTATKLVPSQMTELNQFPWGLGLFHFHENEVVVFWFLPSLLQESSNKESRQRDRRAGNFSVLQYIDNFQV